MLQRLLDLTPGRLVMCPHNHNQLAKTCQHFCPSCLEGNRKQLIEHLRAGTFSQGQGGRGADQLCCCGRKHLSVGSRCALGSPSLCAFFLTPLVLFHPFVLHRLKQLPAWLCSEGGNGCWGWGRKQELANKGVGMRGVSRDLLK